jgi:hypothetical protein
MRLLVGPDTSRREDLADRFPVRRVRPFLCLAGRFYLQFKLSPSYIRDSNQGLKVSPAKKVLNVRKLQDTPLIPAHNGTQGRFLLYDVYPFKTPLMFHGTHYDTLLYPQINTQVADFSKLEPLCQGGL